MFRFTQKSDRSSRTKSSQGRRPRSFVASLEAVEDRKLLSTLTSVSWVGGGRTNYEVFAIGLNNTVSASKNGSAFIPITAGGKAIAISASVNNTVFAIGSDDSGQIDRGGTGWAGLGGKVIAISAGLDLAGNPELYGIGTNNAVYASDNGSGWFGLGGYAKAISASVRDTVFAIASDDSGQIDRSDEGWSNLGGKVKAISAGPDVLGRPEVYGIGTDNAVYTSDNGSGWVGLDSYATEISGTSRTVYARGGDVGQVWISQDGSAINYLGSVPLANPDSAAAYSPPPASAPLFNNNQPSYLDMRQGAAADCWLDASLAEVAVRYPQDIKNMFLYDGTTVDNGATVGLYSVRFFSTNGTAFYVRVDTALPSGGGYYDRVGNALYSQSLWTALAEKGYAEANALGLVTTGAPSHGDYASLNYGDPVWALQAITGKSASEYAVNPTNIANAWTSGQLIVLSTNAPTSPSIVGGHCYAVVGYDAANSEPFLLFNPWGTQANGYAPGSSTIYGLFTAGANFVSSNFVSQAIGTGATHVYGLADPADESPEIATFDHTRPKAFAIVHGLGGLGTAVSSTRPYVGLAIVGGPLS